MPLTVCVSDRNDPRKSVTCDGVEEMSAMMNDRKSAEILRTSHNPRIYACLAGQRATRGARRDISVIDSIVADVVSAPKARSDAGRGS